MSKFTRYFGGSGTWEPTSKTVIDMASNNGEIEVIKCPPLSNAQ